MSLILSGCHLFNGGHSVPMSAIPLAPGSSWTFTTRPDSFITIQDSVRFSIKQTSSLSGNIHSKWTMQYISLEDSSGIDSAGERVYYPILLAKRITDSIIVRSTSGLLHFNFLPDYFGSATLRFPLTVGDKWSDNNNNYSVVSVENVTWNGITYPDCYKIAQKKSTDGIILTSYYWIEPGIGIVRVQQCQINPYGPPLSADHTANVYTSITTWSLISYNVPSR